MRRTLILQQRNDYTDSKNVITTVPETFEYLVSWFKVNYNEILFDLSMIKFSYEILR